MSIFIGGAWPYANGSLHVGHIAGLIGGDVLARYYRMIGEKVLYVSGSDCHGTPIAIRGKKEKVNPKYIALKYHEEFKNTFNRLGFSYDYYGKTNSTFHKIEVQRIFNKLLENNFLYTKEIEQVYCENCKTFLTDRFVEGICPECGSKSRGDQCENCCTILNATALQDKKCKICGDEPTVRKTLHYFFKLSKLQQELEEYVEKTNGWRNNAIELTKRYLNEGLRDRAITRDLDYGISVPVTEHCEKKIYVWIEAVCGYLTASMKYFHNSDEWKEFWNDDTLAYYVHGKDNIPFHTLILPAILKGIGGLHLPDRIISSEYVTLEGKKISTSRNWVINMDDLLRDYDPDVIRYILISNSPEKRDADFSIRELVKKNNGELVGIFGNFVNRTLVFSNKLYGDTIPNGQTDPVIQRQLKSLYIGVGKYIENGEFKKALKGIMEFLKYANKYYDEKQPWVKAKNDKQECANILYTCIQIIANISNVMSPFLPFVSQKIKNMLNIDTNDWSYIEINNNETNKIQILFERI